MPEKEKSQDSASPKETDAKKESAPVTEEGVQRILGMSEISLWLDTYDDIFSDFDPRPYSQRTLSDDFLNEAKKVSRGKSGDRLELRFLIAENNRDQKTESMVKKRLHEHFTKHANQLGNEIKTTRLNSVMTAFLGICIMVAATSIDAYFPNRFLYKFLFVLLEPAGWFTTWFALDRLFYTAEKKKEEHNFYEKMSKCEIMFSSY